MKELVLDDGDRLMSIAEVATRLKCGASLVRQLMAAGFIGYMSFGSIKKISKYELNRFISDNTGQDVYELLNEYRREHGIYGEDEA